MKRSKPKKKSAARPSLPPLSAASTRGPAKAGPAAEFQVLNVTSFGFRKGVASYVAPPNKPWRETEIVLSGTPDTGTGSTVTSALIQFAREGEAPELPFYDAAATQIRLFFPAGDFLEVKAVLESSKNRRCFYVEQSTFAARRAWIETEP